MQAADLERAVAASTSIVSALGLTVDSTVVLSNSNKLAIRILPCDLLARVAHRGQEVAQFEVDLARRLTETRSPVAVLEPRVEPQPYERDGFVVTLWSYYASVGTDAPVAADYAEALRRLHAGMRQVDLATPHFTDRVAEAEGLVAGRDRTPALVDADRELLRDTLRARRRAIEEHGAPEQLLHGEPHPGNLLTTAHGPRFIDLETCCRGPVEFDLAHAPDAVGQHYPEADHDLLRDCRVLVSAMVAAWRSDRNDQYPDGGRARQELLAELRRVQRGRDSTA